jgi:hypothetical protein
LTTPTVDGKWRNEKYQTKHLRENSDIIKDKNFYSGVVKIQGRRPGELTDGEFFALQPCMTRKGSAVHMGGRKRG